VEAYYIADVAGCRAASAVPLDRTRSWLVGADRVPVAVAGEVGMIRVGTACHFAHIDLDKESLALGVLVGKDTDIPAPSRVVLVDTRCTWAPETAAVAACCTS